LHPILIELGSFKIYSYGFMLALSFWVGILIAAKRAERRGIDQNHIYDMSIILILAAVIGSRLLYILTHRADYHSILDVIALWQGGATFYGGFILALAGALVFLRRKRIFFFTRIGCFLSGCCFGRPTDSIFGVVFPPHSPAGFYCEGAAVHPTQLYDSLYGLVMASVLFLVDRRSPFTGFTFGLLCILYGAGRYTIDFFRYYEDSARLGNGMTVSQLASIGLIAVGAVVILIRSRGASRAKRAQS